MRRQLEQFRQDLAEERTARRAEHDKMRDALQELREQLRRLEGEDPQPWVDVMGGAGRDQPRDPARGDHR